MIYRVNKERNILDTKEGTKANWIGHFLRRNCLLKHVVEGKVELKRTSGRIPLYDRLALRRGR